ncbi:MAG: putative peptidoglycan glycosyltransferase FtsW [Candidatus Zixiibacteriota bacterium]
MTNAEVISQFATNAYGRLNAEWVRRRASMPKADRLILLGAMILMALGTIMVLSSSVMLAERRFGAPGFFWKRQLIWWGVAAAIMILVSRIDYRRLRKWILPGLIIAFALLGIVLFASPVNEARRWIPLGPIRIQPSEIFRLVIIMFTAAFFARQAERIENPLQWWPMLAVLGAGSGLIMLQPEFSALLTMWATVGLMVIAAGARWRHTLPVLGVAVTAALIIVFGFEYKKARVDDWREGLMTNTGGSYQVRQSKIALGSGGLVGQGLGRGRAKMLYLPEPHTDFILASIGEELGLLGLTAVFGIVMMMIFRGWKVATRAPDRFGYLLVVGIAGSLLVNAGLNAAVVTGVSPATGLPFPFVSYGGSSLLATAAAWGIVLNVSRFRSSPW